MTDYYVDPSGGNDGNTGLSELQAWQTEAPVNTGFTNGTFAAGDRIRFQRGDTLTLTNRLHIHNCSGDSSDYIELTDYDTGALPIIDGNGLVNCFYRDNGDNAADYYRISNLVFQANDDGAALKLHDLSYWEIVDCTLQDITSTVWCCGIQFRWTDHFLIDGCTFDNIQGEGIYLGEGAQPTRQVTDGLVINCYFDDCNNNMMDLKVGCERIVVAYCVSRNSAAVGEWSHFMAGGRRSLWYGCDFDFLAHRGIQYGAYAADLLGTDATEHVIIRCIFKNGDANFGVMLSAFGNEMYDSVILDNGTGVEVNQWGLAGADDHILRHNHWRGNTTDLDRVTALVDSEFSNYHDGDCTWDVAGGIRNLAWVQANLSLELCADTDVPFGTNAFIATRYKHGGDAMNDVLTWHEGSGAVAIFAARPDFAGALWWDDMSGWTEAQVNAALATFVADFSGLSAEVVTGSSPYEIEAIWHP